MAPAPTAPLSAPAGPMAPPGAPPTAPPTSRLAYAVLRVSPSRTKELSKFLKEKLGMSLVSEDECEYAPGVRSRRLRFAHADPATGAPTRSMGVELFVAAGELKRYDGRGADLYWKVGLAVDDVDAVHQQVFRGRGGRQFLDVGYLCHVQDPAGFTVELLQTTFEDEEEQRKAFVQASEAAWKRAKRPPGLLAVKGSGQAGRAVPGLGQLTIRSSDAGRTRRFYQESLGMQLLCVEPVEQCGFNLDFLGFPDAGQGDAPLPPSHPGDGRGGSFEDVANRCWCYQQAYTTLEVQTSLQAPGGARATKLTQHANDSEGFWGFVVQRTGAGGEGQPCGRELLVDPDGVRILIEHS